MFHNDRQLLYLLTPRMELKVRQMGLSRHHHMADPTASRQILGHNSECSSEICSSQSLTIASSPAAQRSYQALHQPFPLHHLNLGHGLHENLSPIDTISMSTPVEDASTKETFMMQTKR